MVFLSMANIILGEETSETSNRHISIDSPSELKSLQDDYDMLFEDIVALEANAAAAHASAVAAAQIESLELAALERHEGVKENAVAVASPRLPSTWVAQRRGSLTDPVPRFFKIAGTCPIALREAPEHASAKMGRAVKPEDVVRAAEVRVLPGETKNHAFVTWILLRGPWGEGWIFDGLPIRVEKSPPLFFEVDAKSVVEKLGTVWHERDEITHCFRTIAAMTGEIDAANDDTITREAIEHVLPAGWSTTQLDEFFAKYDEDRSGTIDFSEFVEMHGPLRRVWRFEEAWAQFRLVDEDGGGTIELHELHRIVPKGASAEEIQSWLKRFDRLGFGYITLSDYLAVERAVHRDFIQLAVGTSFVLCTYFVYSRVTKSLLSIFSMEEIEGGFYLKLELGTPALTAEHQQMMLVSGIMLVCFSAAVPLVGIFLMFHARKDLNSRKVATVAGFLTDGYRDEIAWLWEFLVLARKLVILGISLFVWDSFLQSFSAIVVLIISIVIQLQVKPFNLPSLNLLELGALGSLLITQLSGILLWYKQQPDKNEYLQPLQYALTGLLFFTNGVVIFGFLFVTFWAWIKEKSKDLIQTLPSSYPIFVATMKAEDNIHWAVSGIFCPHVYNQSIARERAEEWSFLIAERAGVLFNRGFVNHQLKEHGKRMRAFKKKCSCCRSRQSGRESLAHSSKQQTAWEREMSLHALVDFAMDESDVGESSSDSEHVVMVRNPFEKLSGARLESKSSEEGASKQHSPRRLPLMARQSGAGKGRGEFSQRNPLAARSPPHDDDLGEFSQRNPLARSPPQGGDLGEFSQRSPLARLRLAPVPPGITDVEVRAKLEEVRSLVIQGLVKASIYELLLAENDYPTEEVDAAAHGGDFKHHENPMARPNSRSRTTRGLSPIPDVITDVELRAKLEEVRGLVIQGLVKPDVFEQLMTEMARNHVKKAEEAKTKMRQERRTKMSARRRQKKLESEQHEEALKVEARAALKIRLAQRSSARRQETTEAQRREKRKQRCALLDATRRAEEEKAAKLATEKKAAELEKKADVHVSEDARRLARRELRKIRRVVARGGT